MLIMLFSFPDRDTSLRGDWPTDVRSVAAEDGAGGGRSL